MYTLVFFTLFSTSTLVILKCKSTVIFFFLSMLSLMSHGKVFARIYNIVASNSEASISICLTLMLNCSITCLLGKTCTSSYQLPKEFLKFDRRRKR